MKDCGYCEEEVDFVYTCSDCDWKVCRDCASTRPSGEYICHECWDVRLVVKADKTQRGFPYLTFKDTYGLEAKIQESSSATGSKIWFGPDEPEAKVLVRGQGWKEIDAEKIVKEKYPESDVLFSSRLHLSIPQAKGLIKILEHFVESGGIPDEEMLYKMGIELEE